MQQRAVHHLFSGIAGLGGCFPNLFGMVTNEDKEPLDKLDELPQHHLASCTSGKSEILPPAYTAYLIPHEIPARYQGRQTILEPDKKKAKKLKTKAEQEHFNLPAGTADDNQNITTIQADIDNTCSPSAGTNTTPEHKRIHAVCIG